jgi:hypothetical protein
MGFEGAESAEEAEGDARNASFSPQALRHTSAGFGDRSRASDFTGFEGTEKGTHFASPRLCVSASRRGRGCLLDAGAAEEFQEEDHLVILVGGAGGGTVLLELGDTGGQFGAGAAGLPVGFEDAGAEVLGDELELVGGEAVDKAPGAGAAARFGTGN